VGICLMDFLELSAPLVDNFLGLKRDECFLIEVMPNEYYK